jgi:hypothetical protein
MLQWLIDNKNWLFSGLGLVIVIGFLKFSRSQVVDYLRQRLLRSLEENFNKKFKKRLERILSESPKIEAEIDVDPNEIEFYCVTYRQNENRKLPYESKWIEKDKFKINASRNGFVLTKKDISSRMENSYDPYKFYMTVPNSPKTINKYYIRLLQARHVVTGRGGPDEEKNKWRIWFLLNSQPIHPHSQNPKTLNHTLENPVFIKNNQTGKLVLDSK